MPDIEITNYLNATPHVVYEALTTQKGLAEVWTRECTVKPEIGFENIFRFGGEEPTSFKITELAADKLVRWRCTASDPEWVETEVFFELAEQSGKTRVTLIHSGWKEMTDFTRWCNYNWGFFLYSLKKYCEEGSGIPFQERTF
ncbi:MAG: SRPBCC domain-containing protein [Balneolaceae bacterium]